jgi:hypothetical protein
MIYPNLHQREATRGEGGNIPSYLGFTDYQIILISSSRIEFIRKESTTF